MSEELIGRLRVATRRNYESGLTVLDEVTCPHALKAGYEGGCRSTHSGHLCRLTDPHPSGYSHECRCGVYW